VQRALVLIFLSLSIEAVSAQSAPRDPGRDDALNAAIAISSHIQFLLKRLSLCSELDTRNSATYIFVSGEYLRDATIGDAITKTEHLIDAELRSIAGNQERAQKAKAIREREFEKLYQKRREQALAAPGQFQQDCRQLAQYFLLRQGPFRPLRTIYPKEMSDIDIWYVFESARQP
jgi:hypothetical protein